MERRPTKSPIEQLQEVSDDVEAGWVHVIVCMKQATFELLPDISGEDRERLETNFWAHHPEVMWRAELYQPGISDVIMTRAESISAELLS